MWSMSKWAEGKEKTDDELPILIFKLANAFFFFFITLPVTGDSVHMSLRERINHHQLFRNRCDSMS